MRKKLLPLLLTAVMLFSLTACGGTVDVSAVKSKSLMGSESATVRFKVGTTTAPEGHYVMGLLEMQRLLEKYSNGEMTLDVYPNSLLGNERDMMELVGLGIQDMALISTGPIPNFVPDFAVLDLPYLFETETDAYEALDGPVGQNLLAQLDAIHIYGVGFWENGFRHVTNNKKPIEKPSDLRGLKIRTMENNVHIATYETLSAMATPMAWSEIFTALSQGTVDGQENPLTIIESSKVYEVQDHLSLINLFYSPCVLMMSQESYDRLTSEQQQIYDRAAEEAKDWQRNYSREYEKTALELMEQSGVTITEVDLDLWKEAAAPIYDRATALNLNTELIDLLRKERRSLT